MQSTADRQVFELRRQALFAAGPIAAKQHGYGAAVFHFAFSILSAEQRQLMASFIEHLDNEKIEVEE